MAELDLRQRAGEARDEPHTLTMPDGAVFHLQPRFPLLSIEYMLNGRLTDAARLLLVDEEAGDAERFATYWDADFLEQVALGLYAMSLGESPALAASSLSNGSPPRPTSPATTP